MDPTGVCRLHVHLSALAGFTLVQMNHIHTQSLLGPTCAMPVREQPK